MKLTESKIKKELKRAFGNTDPESDNRCIECIKNHDCYACSYWNVCIGFAFDWLLNDNYEVKEDN